MLAEETWIVGRPGHPCVDITLTALAFASITPRTCHQVNDWDAVVALVAQGAGVALVPALALRVGTPTVAVVPVRPAQPQRSIYAAIRNGSSRAPHIAAVLDALLAAVRLGAHDQRTNTTSVVDPIPLGVRRRATP